MSGPATQTILLDQAIQTAANDIENSVDNGVKIAVLNFSSPSEQFSGYVLDELSINLVNGKKLTVVDRKELDLIRREENFQLSGEVSDESAQSIGKKLGAQMIVSGSLDAMGRTYRFRIKTLNVETAAIEVFSSFDVNTREEKIVYLLAGKKPSSKVNNTPQSAKAGSVNLSWSGPWIQAGMLQPLIWA
jgi:TolB-like protein